MCIPLTDLAYFAGLFDGEGYIGIRRVSRTGWHGNGTYALQLTIANTIRSPLDEAQAIWHGKVVKGQGTNRPCFHWHLHGRMAAAFLQDILPYLRIKRQQAEVALEYQGRIKSTSRTPITEEEMMVREQCMQRLKDMKKE
jgi:hypothetical protein